jgi:hypothetical protein
MKANRLLSALLVAGLCATSFGDGTDAHAAGKKKADAAAAQAADPPDATNPIDLALGSVAWGQSVGQVEGAIDKLIDADYDPVYKKTPPGRSMTSLDAEVAEAKDQFRRSRIDFGKLPTSYDSSSIKGEYTYNNGEAVMELPRKGKKSYLFFIQKKLWKIITEVTYGNGKEFGKNFGELAVKFTEQLGVPGRIVPADPAKNRYDQEVDWRDGKTHVRLVDRGERGFAILALDRSVEANIDAMRPNKPVDDTGIDPSVADVLRKGGDEAAPPPKAEDAKSKPKGSSKGRRR